MGKPVLGRCIAFRSTTALPVLRPYADRDWDAVLELCLLAFTPGCEALGRMLGARLEWRSSVERHLRSLTRPDVRQRVVVAESRGSVVGFVHYEVDRETKSGSVGLSAVQPAEQGKGIGTLLVRHALGAMRAEGLRYATAEAGCDATAARARRAYEKAGFIALPKVHYFMKLEGGRRGPARTGPRQRRGR